MIITENPLKKSGLFHTPSSTEELQGYLGRFSGAEAIVANTCALMAWNLASKLIDDTLDRKDEE